MQGRKVFLFTTEAKKKKKARHLVPDSIEKKKKALPGKKRLLGGVANKPETRHVVVAVQTQYNLYSKVPQRKTSLPEGTTQNDNHDRATSARSQARKGNLSAEQINLDVRECCGMFVKWTRERGGGS